MEYATPQLSLVGRAMGIVLGGVMELQPDSVTTAGRPRTTDSSAVD
jgi:hypothetical protein